MSVSRMVSVQVNGRIRSADVEVRLSLADFLRDRLGLRGTRLGCEHGVCGACTVLFDDQPLRSCLLFAVQASGHEITTVEGLSERSSGRALAAAFRSEFAAQCGFCTPGFLVTATALLESNPKPSEADVRVGLSGNICRCTGYSSIISAVLRAAEGEV